MRIAADDEICVASGQCVMHAPEFFDQREEDGMVVLLRESALEQGEQESVRRAARVCPALAITLTEQ